MSGRNCSLVIFAVFVVAILAGFFGLHGTYLISALVLAGIYTIAIIGLVVLTGLNGQYSLGHAAFFGIGAYASAILARQGIQSVFADGLSVLITTALAVIIGMPLLRLRGYYLAVATLAFGLIASSLFTGWRSLTLGPSGLGDIPPLSFGGWALKGDAAYYVLVWFVASLCILACNNLWRSRIGQAMLAVKRDEAAAAAMGINVASIKLQAFGLSALLASLSGALYAHYLGFIAPERFGTTTSFELLLAALLGGVGTPYGAVFGALLLIALPEMFVALQD
jgi:branched-chain amino acid transport system permease protein